MTGLRVQRPGLLFFGPGSPSRAEIGAFNISLQLRHDRSFQTPRQEAESLLRTYHRTLKGKRVVSPYSRRRPTSHGRWSGRKASIKHL
jgi:hypothetical protein